MSNYNLTGYSIYYKESKSYTTYNYTGEHCTIQDGTKFHAKINQNLRSSLNNECWRCFYCTGTSYGAICGYCNSAKKVI